MLSERERGGGEDPEQPERESSQTVKGFFLIFLMDLRIRRQILGITVMGFRIYGVDTISW